MRGIVAVMPPLVATEDRASDAAAPSPPPDPPPRGRRVARRGPRSVATALLRATRPGQWPKNLLVLTAPAAVGSITDAGVRSGALLALLVFTCAAAGTYLLNDVVDRDADAHHPTKRLRPIAAGEVSPRVATAVGIGLLGMAVALPVGAGEWALSGAVLAYLAAAVAYNAGAKRVAGVELGLVAGFYVLRAVGGAVASGVRLPVELGAVVAAVALYLVIGKRAAELASVGPGAGTRPVLERYGAGRLDDVRRAAAVAGLVGYALWVTDRAGADPWGPWLVLSIVPVALCFHRYERLIRAGDGERPDVLVWSDRMLRGLALVGTAIAGIGIYGG